MRWIWIDRIVALEAGRRCVTVKNVSLAEDVLHDHFPATESRVAMPVMPNTLVIEGMAQTAGILVGHARGFSEKVILAKIGRAVFVAAARPGHTIRYEAVLDRVDEQGAATSGTVTRIDPASGESTPMGEVRLTFSHLDQNRSGLAFPEHNFVFTEQFMNLVRDGGFASGGSD